MSEMTPFVGTCYEDVPKVLRSYVKKVNEAAITQAAVTSVSYLVNQYENKNSALADTDPVVIQVETTAGVVSGLVFDTAQPWDVDLIGYNFQFTAPAASFPIKGKWYVIECWITQTDGIQYPAGIWILECQPTRKD